MGNTNEKKLNNEICSSVYKHIDEIIYSNKVNIIINDPEINDSDNDKYKDNTVQEVENLLNIYNQNVKVIKVSDILASIAQNKKISVNQYTNIIDKVQSCLYNKYSNENNFKEVNQNTNEVDSNNKVLIVLFPMIFINGMNIGTLKNLKNMEYRKELNKFF